MKTLHLTRWRLAGWPLVALVAALVCAGAAWGAVGRAGKTSAGTAPGAHVLPVAVDTPRPALAAGAVPPEEASPGGFSHRVHRSVGCTDCHLSQQSHGALKIRTLDDCRACHHSPAQKTGCTGCHQGGALPPPSLRNEDVQTSVARAPSRRSLPFSHAFHGSVGCVECHGSPPRAEPERSCSSCHDQHHTEARACLRCHRPQDVRGHPAAAVHVGCAGGGCHTDAAVNRLSWSRGVCLGCHQDRTEHQKSSDCAACHQVPALHANRQEVAR